MVNDQLDPLVELEIWRGLSTDELKAIRIASSMPLHATKGWRAIGFTEPHIVACLVSRDLLAPHPEKEGWWVLTERGKKFVKE